MCLVHPVALNSDGHILSGCFAVVCVCTVCVCVTACLIQLLEIESRAKCELRWTATGPHCLYAWLNQIFIYVWNIHKQFSYPSKWEIIFFNNKNWISLICCCFLMPLKIAHIQLLIVSQMTHNTFVWFHVKKKKKDNNLGMLLTLN